MNGFPEWFIGGPWHGRDRRREMPHNEGYIRVAFANPERFRAALLADHTILNHELSVPIHEEVSYVARTFAFMGRMITCYVLETDVPDMAESIPLLRDLIMAPHRDTPPGGVPRFNAREYGDLYANAFINRHNDAANQDRSRERRLEAQLADMRRQWIASESVIRRLNQEREAPEQVHRYRCSSDEHVSSIQSLETQPAARLEWSYPDDENVGSILASGFLLYFDEGSKEFPPSWCATLPRNSDGMNEYRLRDYFGYGPDKTSAILAMIADVMGYFVSIRKVEKPSIPPIVRPEEEPADDDETLDDINDDETDEVGW